METVQLIPYLTLSVSSRLSDFNLSIILTDYFFTMQDNRPSEIGKGDIYQDLYFFLFLYVKVENIYVAQPIN